MTTYEYIRWKANNTRASKIVKKKSDKAATTVVAAEEDEKGHQESPGPALPLNVDFMDSSKRLAGLMTSSTGNKPSATDNSGHPAESKVDISDAGFYKLDPMAAMSNTATNFGAGIEK